jgi:hypothetical protein
VELKDKNMRYKIRIWKINMVNRILTLIPKKLLFLVFTRIAAIACWYHPTKEFGSITIQEIAEALVN